MEQPIYHTIKNEYRMRLGTDNEIYYKCLKCEAVGNWREFIISGKCHEEQLGKKQ